MPPYPGIPYGVAPGWCFIVFEFSMYLLFLACLAHAVKRSKFDVLYLLGGLAFGLLLEYMEVLLGSYTYGRFTVMLGKAPMDIPLCIGVGWGIIMYSARLFTDRLGLSLLACAALDTLLALNIDLSMDTVAYRLHMWHWNWVGTGLNPLTAQWFGIPFGNFIGWQTVVFCYSYFSRLFEKGVIPRWSNIGGAVLVAVSALICSLAVLYTSEIYLFPLLERIHIMAVHRFVAISVLLIILTIRGWNKRPKTGGSIPGLAWWVPGWFHVYFFCTFFIVGFYTENKWMTIAAGVNFLIGVAIHVFPAIKRKATGAGTT